MTLRIRMIAEFGWALEQLWLFWLAPIIGAALAGSVYRYFEQDALAETGQEIKPALDVR